MQRTSSATPKSPRSSANKYNKYLCPNAVGVMIRFYHLQLLVELVVLLNELEAVDVARFEITAMRRRRGTLDDDNRRDESDEVP